MLSEARMHFPIDVPSSSTVSDHLYPDTGAFVGSNYELNSDIIIYLFLQAIQNPNDEALQDQAWAAVVPLVGKLKKFYEFSLRLGNYACFLTVTSVVA